MPSGRLEGLGGQGLELGGRLRVPRDRAQGVERRAVRSVEPGTEGGLGANERTGEPAREPSRERLGGDTPRKLDSARGLEGGWGGADRGR